MSNIYGLMFDKADDWLTQIQNLYGEALNWQVFQDEFQKEYLTKNYQKEKLAAFINLTQGMIAVREYMDKFEDLYKHAKEIYPTEEKKSEKFREGLHVSLRGKLNLYAGTTF